MRARVLGAFAFLLAVACTGRMGMGPAAPHGDGTQDVVVLLFNKASTPVVDASVYVDDVCVARGTYEPWKYGVEPPRVRVRLAPGAHRMRAVFAGANAAAEVEVDAHAENVWQLIYTADPHDIGSTVVPAGVVIERLRPC
jgi:hypothetical protein